MAKNGDPEKPVESESDVDGEEDEDETSSEQDVSSDPEAEQTETQTSRKEKKSSTPAALKKSQPHPSSKLPQQPSSSSDEEESGSESDSESDGSDSNIKPLASKPIDDSQKFDNGARKPRSKPVSPVKSAGAKRPAEEKVEDKDMKKSMKRPVTESENKKTGPTKDDSKKQLFQRLWSEDDEIVVLKGMIDYEDLNNAQPVADLNAFHDFIKKNLHVDVTRAQLQDKIRRLKKKYVNNRAKEIEGKDMTFTRPHEQIAYEWSKKVWLKENGKKTRAKNSESPSAKGNAVRKSSSKRAKMVEIGEATEVRKVEVANSDVEMSAAERLCANGVSVEERILLEDVELFAREKKVDCEREWKKLKLEEMEFYLKKLDFLRAQTKLILDVMKSTNY